MPLVDSYFDLLPQEHLHAFAPEVDLVATASLAGIQRRAFLKVVENRLFFRFERMDANWNFVALENLERAPDSSREIHLRELFLGALSGQGGIGRLVHFAADAHFLFEPFGKVTLFVNGNEPLQMLHGERLSLGSFMARDANYWLHSAHRLEENPQIHKTLEWLRLSRPEKMRALVQINGDWDEARRIVEAHARSEEILKSVAKNGSSPSWFVWLDTPRGQERGFFRPFFYDRNETFELDFSPRFKSFSARFLEQFRPRFNDDYESARPMLGERLAKISGCPIEFTLPQMSAHEELENLLLLESWSAREKSETSPQA